MRKPKPENCTFFDSVALCIEVGFWACKRCHPLQPMAEADPSIKALLAALERDPARRSFRRHFGLTFLEMARQHRLRRGIEILVCGGQMLDAQLDAGFESASAFRKAIARLLGPVPGTLKRDALLRA